MHPNILLHVDGAACTENWVLCRNCTTHLSWFDTINIIIMNADKIEKKLYLNLHTYSWSIIVSPLSITFRFLRRVGLARQFLNCAPQINANVSSTNIFTGLSLTRCPQCLSWEKNKKKKDYVYADLVAGKLLQNIWILEKLITLVFPKIDSGC